MAEAYENISLNVTKPSTVCESFLGNITVWSFAVYLFINVIAVTENLLLLCAVYKDPLKCLRNSSTYFIVNGAIADVLSLLYFTGELFTSHTEYKTGRCFSQPWFTVNLTLGHFAYFLSFPSATVLALERYLSIAHPLLHKVKVTFCVVCTCVTLVWLVCFIPAAVSAAFVHDLFVYIGVFSAFPLSFYLTTIVLYFLAFISIRRQRLLLITDNSKSETVKRILKLRLKNQNRFLATVFIVNLNLILGMLPLLLAVISDFLISIQLISKNTKEQLLYFICISYFASLAVNPFLYIWRLAKYRKTFLVLYFKRT